MSENLNVENNEIPEDEIGNEDEMGNEDVVGDGDQDSSQGEEPRYITQQAFEDALARQNETVRDTFAQLNTQLQGVYKVLSPKEESQKPKSPLPEDPDEFNETVTNSNKLHKVLKDVFVGLKGKIDNLESRYNKDKELQEEQHREKKYYDYIKNEISRSASSYPVFKSEDAMQLLKSQVSLELHKTQGVLDNVSFPAITKKVASMLKYDAPKPDMPTRGLPVHIPVSSRTIPGFKDIKKGKKYTHSELSEIGSKSLEDIYKMMENLESGE